MDNILFDLDGTLTDPFLGICRAVAYSLKYFHSQLLLTEGGDSCFIFY